MTGAAESGTVVEARRFPELSYRATVSDETNLGSLYMPSAVTERFAFAVTCPYPE